MSNTVPKARVLLLVEDNPGDADLVAELLAEDDYQLVHVPRISDAVKQLESLEVHVVVLDLRLPDCDGVDSVKRMRAMLQADVPIVVMTGSDDEELALECIAAGANDYLTKKEVHAMNLRRAIGYAVGRLREAQIRQLHETLENYRSMSSKGAGTSITAALAGSGAVYDRYPEIFSDLVQRYFGLIEPYLKRLTDEIDAPREHKERIVTMLGDAGGGPRDLLDVHVAALDRAIAWEDDPRSHRIVSDSRLLALEMMGLLVDYYRVGNRRLYEEGARR